MFKKFTIVLGMAVAVAGTTTVSSFVFVPEAQAFGFKSIKKAAKKVGRKVKKSGKAVGRTAKKGGKAAVIKGLKGAAKAGEYEVRGFHKVGRGAKRAGRAIKSYAKCVKQGGCGRIGDLPPGTKGNPRPTVRIRPSSAPVTAHRG